MHYSVCLQTLDDQVAPMWIFNVKKTFLYGSWMKMQLLSILDYFVTWLCTVLHGHCMVNIYGCYWWIVDGDVNVPYVDNGLISGCFGCVYWNVMSMICVIYWVVIWMFCVWKFIIEWLCMFDHSVWISDSYVYVLCVDAGLLCGCSVWWIVDSYMNILCADIGWICNCS